MYTFSVYLGIRKKKKKKKKKILSYKVSEFSKPNLNNFPLKRSLDSIAITHCISDTETTHRTLHLFSHILLNRSVMIVLCQFKQL